jgi:hypothetical protein
LANHGGTSELSLISELIAASVLRRAAVVAVPTRGAWFLNGFLAFAIDLLFA